MPDDFEWDITEDDEAPPAAAAEANRPTAPEPARPAPSTRLWLGLILTVALLALGGVWWSSRDQQQGQLNRTVTAMANDERSAAPLPFGLTDISDRILQNLTDEGSGRIAATLTFTATFADGTPLTFTVDRTYTAEGTLLRREQLPSDEASSVLAPATSSARVEFEVLGADREFVQRDVAPYLNDLARRACALWACPPNAFVQVSFTATNQGPSASRPDLAGSWQLALSDRLRGITVFRVPPPHLAGVPADAVTLDAYRRVLALHVLPLLADAVVEPEGRPFASRITGVVDALVARTAVHLGLEPASVLAAIPSADDNGPLNDLTLSQTQTAERAFRRLNALLGPSHQEVERLTWRRLGTAQQVDATAAIVSAFAQENRDPTEALALIFGARPAQAVLEMLSHQSWFARVECQDSIVQFNADGTAAFELGSDIERSVVSFFDVSPGGRWQALSLARAPVLLDQHSGRLFWLPFADGANDYGIGLQWLTDDELGLASIGDQVRTVRVGILDRDDGSVELSVTPFEWIYQQFPPDQSETHLEWTYETNDNDTFSRMRLVRSNGTRVVDFGLATYPVYNPETGEYALLDLIADGPYGPEYRVRVFSGPDDPEGRIVWESHNKALYAEVTPHSGALAWIPRTHQIALVIQTVESLRDMYVEAGFWIIDADTGESSRLWWQPVNGIHAQSFALSGDQGFLALSNSDAGSPAAIVQIVSVSTGDTVRTFSLFNGQLSWAPTGQGFALVDTDGIKVFSAPDQPVAPLHAAGVNCGRVTWGTIPLGAAPVPQPGDLTVP